MHKFAHIDAFYQVARYVAVTNDDLECPEQYKIRSAVDYRGTVKLHGTNSAVVCSGHGLVAQSRTRQIAVGDDNCGFAAFAMGEAQSHAVRRIEAEIRREHSVCAQWPVVIFGEWVGPGIQRGTGMNQLAEKQWVVFAVMVVDGDDTHYIDAVPKLGNRYETERIYSICDGPRYSLKVDFSSRDALQNNLREIDQITKAVERQCPWAKRFGIEGIGEGVVWTPINRHWGNSNLCFKSKGDKHSVTKTRRDKPALDPEVLASVNEFVDFAVPDTRLEQGLDAVREQGVAIEMAVIPRFLKWVTHDVQRECALELQASGLEWKQVAKAVTTRAREFFVYRLRTLV